jgi:UDP-N-acetylmuramoyl-L-alanyl-D-glutamate--2,6-diaminopimelate ligase
MRFATLLRRLANARLLPASGTGAVRPDRALPEATRGTEIDHIADDSRQVGPGGLFVAVRGHETDGHQFIEQAVENGAAAVLCEEVPEGNGDSIESADPLPAEADLDALAEGRDISHQALSERLRRGIDTPVQDTLIVDDPPPEADRPEEYYGREPPGAEAKRDGPHR